MFKMNTSAVEEALGKRRQQSAEKWEDVLWVLGRGKSPKSGWAVFSGKAQYGFFFPNCFVNRGAHLGVQMDRQFGHDGLHGWSRARLLCHLLGVNGPVGFCVLARLLLPGAGKVHPCPVARLVVPCVLCSPKSQMARLVGTAWVTAVRGASRSAEGKGHQSHCHSKVWAPQCLPRHGCLSCRCSVTPAQISPAHRRWQRNPGLVQLIWVLLHWGVLRSAAGGRSWEHRRCWCPGLPPPWLEEEVGMAFRVPRGQAPSRRALGGAAGNRAAMKGQQGHHLHRLLGAGLSSSWALPAFLGTTAVAERPWPFSSPVE